MQIHPVVHAHTTMPVDCLISSGTRGQTFPNLSRWFDCENAKNQNESDTCLSILFWRAFDFDGVANEMENNKRHQSGRDEHVMLTRGTCVKRDERSRLIDDLHVILPSNHVPVRWLLKNLGLILYVRSLPYYRGPESWTYLKSWGDVSISNWSFHKSMKYKLYNLEKRVFILVSNIFFVLIK